MRTRVDLQRLHDDPVKGGDGLDEGNDGARIQESQQPDGHPQDQQGGNGPRADGLQAPVRGLWPVARCKRFRYLPATLPALRSEKHR